MQQRRFTKEFEEEAVRLVQTSGRTQREIAGDLGIGLSTLVRWISRSRDRRAADPTTTAEGDLDPKNGTGKAQYKPDLLPASTVLSRTTVPNYTVAAIPSPAPALFGVSLACHVYRAWQRAGSSERIARWYQRW